VSNRLLVGYLCYMNEANRKRRLENFNKSLTSMSRFKNQSCDVFAVKNNCTKEFSNKIDAQEGIDFSVSFDKNFWDISVLYATAKLARDRGYEYCMYTYDDFVVYRDDFVDDCMSYLDKNTDVGCVRVPKYQYEKRDRSDSVVINGCNSSFFYPAENKERSSGDKLKIVTHHWSDNPMKGADIYRAVDQLCNEDPDISFTYVGRYPKGYSPKNTKVIPPTYGKKIGDILREHDIYITGARFEACGMHHLEGAACGLPVIYHKDGGAINEICSDHGIEISSWEELVEAINFFKNKENLVEYFKKIDYNKIKGQNCYKKYHEIFKDLSGEKGEKE